MLVGQRRERRLIWRRRGRHLERRHRHLRRDWRGGRRRKRKLRGGGGGPHGLGVGTIRDDGAVVLKAGRVEVLVLPLDAEREVVELHAGRVVLPHSGRDAGRADGLDHLPTREYGCDLRCDWVHR